MWVPNTGSASVCHGCLGINVSNGGAVHLIRTPSSSTSHVKEELTNMVQLTAPPWAAVLFDEAKLFVCDKDMSEINFANDCIKNMSFLYD